MKKIILRVASIVSIIAISLYSCDERELNLNRVDVPFAFAIDQNGDEVGIINESENFVGVISIDENYTGPRDGKQFYLEANELHGYSGELLVNGSAYENGQGIAPGNTVFKYTSEKAGLHQVVFTITNEVGRIVRDTFECNIKQFATVAFSVTATPTEWIATTVRPGTQKDFQLKITSADLTGTKPYYLSYTNMTTNGQSSIFISSNSVFTSGDALPSRTVNLKLNIPQSHPDGVYELKLTIGDENGDTKDIILKYSVKAAVKPVISEAFVEIAFQGTTTSNSDMMTCYQYSSCYSPMPYGGPYIGTNAVVKATFNDPDGTISQIRITVNGSLNTYTASGTSHNQTYNIGNSYWQAYATSSSTGCTYIKYYPSNGKNRRVIVWDDPPVSPISDVCGDSKIPDWTIPGGSVVKIQVKDNEGIWSDEYVTSMPGYDVLINNKPSNLN